MRCAVPSSKVGSCDSASAAAERDSGVDAAAAAGLAAAACAGFAVAAGAEGFVGGGAAPAVPALCANAGAAASTVTRASIVDVRMLDVPGRRRPAHDLENCLSAPVAEQPDRSRSVGIALLQI